MITAEQPLVLGSASPRRRAIVGELGLPVVVVAADIAETSVAGEAPREFLERIVGDKLAAVTQRLGRLQHAGGLVADTIVVVDGDILGKPSSDRDASALLHRLAGRSHSVMTRYALAPADSDRVTARTVETEVVMRAAIASEISGYVATGEGIDKAGAYAIQGIGSFLVERISGSYSNVVGLPACELVSDLLACGMLERYP